MSYDKPKLRDFKHGAPYVSIWYSIVIHAILFITALNLAKLDLGKITDDVKSDLKEVIAGVMNKELSPNDAMINELFKANRNLSFDKNNIKFEKNGS
jgi:hypothetical protein